MNISIKQNEPFAMLCVATGYSAKTLEEIILKRLLDEGVICGENEDCGKSLQQIGENSGYDIFNLKRVLFPEGINNDEVVQLLDSIFIWGTSTNEPCPWCGCDLGYEEESNRNHKWKNWSCTNFECDYENTSEPDWDTMPGGKDYQ